MTKEEIDNLRQLLDEPVKKEGELSFMPYGDYNGGAIVNLPNWYLLWSIEQDWLKDNLRKPMEREILRRTMKARQVKDEDEKWN